jgi:hypothetical protein
MSDELWMQTANGRKFPLLDPRPEHVFADDIISALPLIPCFTGAQKAGKWDWPYSVAQHCTLVSRLVAPELALDALLHDAWKVYVGDLTRPLNHLLNDISNGRWGDVRNRIRQAVAVRFGVRWPLPDAVEEADRLARAIELRDVMPKVPELWDLVLPDPPANRDIFVWSPDTTRKTFAARWRELQPEIF